MFTKNLIQLTGNIAKNPETRTVGETTVTRARLIHNETIRKADGTEVERVAAVDLDIWGKRGEALEPYIKKGGKVTVSGRVSARAHEGKAYLQINAQEITLQGSGGRGDQGGGYDSGNHEPQGGGMDDEIPF